MYARRLKSGKDRWKPHVSAGVSARPLQRSATVLQGSCWSLRRSVAARLLPDALTVTFGTTIRIACLHQPSSATVAALQAEGIEVARPISDQNWGLLTAITLPGGVELDLYQPRHPTATQPS